MSGIRERKRKKLRRRRRKRLIRKAIVIAFPCISFLIVISIIFAIKGVLFPAEPERKKAETKQESKKSEDLSHINIKKAAVSKGAAGSKGKPVTLTISAVGDCTLGTDENFDQSRSLNAYYQAQGADYFLKNVRSVFEKDDLTMVNFEGTLTTHDARAEKKFAFKGDPEYASILSGSSVEAANVANNHSHDYGEQGFTDTLSTLEQADIAAFGYDDPVLATVKGIKVGLIGVNEIEKHEGEETQIRQNIKALKKAGAQLLILNIHWGIEREYEPNARQIELAHYAIDQGADLVIGHHPHVLQSMEKYKGKYIAYSLGNFCFGGNSNPQDKDTIIFQQTFTFEDKKLKETDDVNIIPCSLSSSSNKNDYCPRILEEGEKEQAEKKVLLRE